MQGLPCKRSGPHVCIWAVEEIWRRPSCAVQAVLRQGHGMPAASAKEQTCRLHCAMGKAGCATGDECHLPGISSMCAPAHARAHCARGERLTMQRHQHDIDCSRPPQGGCLSTSHPTLLGHGDAVCICMSLRNAVVHMSLMV